MSSTSRITELAEIISSSIAQIQSILNHEGSKPLSFDVDAPTIPPTIANAQSAVLDATAELNNLLTDPFSRLQALVMNDEAAVLKTVATFRIASLVPVGSQTSFADIASKTPLTEQMVARIIRHAATFHVFLEPKPGFAAHTQASRMLIDPNLNDWLLAGNEESTPSVAKLPEALAKWPGSQDFSETAYTLAHGAPLFAVMSQNPNRAKRSGAVVNLQMSQPPFDTKYGLQAYDWASLGEAHVVDVGGGMGRFALPLARQFPNLRITVQDMPQIVALAQAGDLTDRVKFEAYDYFSPQKVHADVFSFRNFFHTWSDKYAIEIIKAQVPAMKTSSKVIVQQELLPEPGVGPRWRERQLRAKDIEYAAFLNGGERTLEDMKTLFTTADQRFVFKNVTEPEGSALALLEFVWEGTAPST